MQKIKSFLFFLNMVVTAILFSVPAVLTFPFPFEKRYAFISQWARFNIWALGKICGLTFEVKGAENIPNGASIILSKHQSTWETFALQVIFPPQIWVLKKNLLKIPFFGWALAMLDPIAINRSARKKAMEQILEQGKTRLDNNRWVVLFPEGTRIAPGVRGKYKLGGIRLAEHTGRLIVPVAHNAGEFWPKHSMTKRAGVITLSVLPPIDPKGKTTSELGLLVENSIEDEMKLITTLS
ncbi:MAG: 1-acyl-sn-glycerol-3-phosphate acyltransferase [Gammaproteobacteria bacterium]|nr:1-acyl-sn-glycerol-3-phosphate acyltransferase [Gammaproteobacteria bacterium]